MRVCVVAPMWMELRPFVRAARLRRHRDGCHRGRVGDNDVVAACVGVGTMRAAQATAALLERCPCDHVIVIGVAGGIGAGLCVGDLHCPGVVEDASTGDEFVPAASPGRRPQGRLLTTDELMVGADAERLAARGVAAVDMETAAVARVSEEGGVAWSVVRALSDHVRDGLVTPEVVELLGADGRADVGAALRHVVTGTGRTRRVRNLARLARDSQRAASVAATAAVGLCGALS